MSQRCRQRPGPNSFYIKFNYLRIMYLHVYVKSQSETSNLSLPLSSSLIPISTSTLKIILNLCFSLILVQVVSKLRLLELCFLKRQHFTFSPLKRKYPLLHLSLFNKYGIINKLSNRMERTNQFSSNFHLRNRPTMVVMEHKERVHPCVPNNSLNYLLNYV